MSMDQAVLQTFPVAIAPHEGQLAKAEKPGIRHILAADGTYREITTCWMVRRKLHGRCTLPYGKLHQSLEFLMDAPPPELWREFVTVAKKALPFECAALMVWNQKTHQWRLAERISTFSSKERIVYLEPELGEDDLPIVDIHSHGHYGASFTPIDDKDDAGGIKIAVAIGRVDHTTPEFAIRLIAIDEFISLALTGEGKFTERLQ